MGRVRKRPDNNSHVELEPMRGTNGTVEYPVFPSENLQCPGCTAALRLDRARPSSLILPKGSSSPELSEGVSVPGEVRSGEPPGRAID
jgi:hypothetical protein